MPVLEVLTGKAAGQTVDLPREGGDWVLGTRRTAALVVRDPWISFSHAVISHDGEGYLIRDKESRAGTFVNGQKISGRGSPLRDGDTIGLGKTEIRFLDDVPAPRGGGLGSAGGGLGSASGGRVVVRERTPQPAAAPVDDGAGPFEPIPAEEHAGGTVSVAEVNQLREERARNEANLTALRQAVAAREQSLSQAQARVRELEARLQSGGGVSGELAELKAKARARIEELTRQNELLRLQAAHEGQPPLPDPGPQLEALRAQLARAEQERDRLQARLEEVSGDAARLARAELRISSLEQELAQAQAAPAAEAQAPSEEVDALQTLIAELNQELAALKRDRGEALDAITQRDRQLEVLKAQLEEAREEAQNPGDAARATVLEQRLEAAEARARKLEDELDEASARPSEEVALAERVRELETTCEALGRDKEDLVKEAAELRQDLEDINEDMLAQEEEYLQRIEALEARLGEAKQEGDS